MKQLHVPRTKGIGKKFEFSELLSQLEGLPKQTIGERPWPAYPYQPKVHFCIAHTGQSILLQYQVAEQHVRCVHLQTNDPVYQDSCVEFFIAFDDTGYYNLEFNCLGTAMVGYGTGRENRGLLDPQIIQQIGRHANMPDEKKGLPHWSLLLNIPIEIFVHHSIPALDGVQCKANFYKCGDLTPEPHFLAWNRIEAPAPDFHLPSFFGQLHFA